MPCTTAVLAIAATAIFCSTFSTVLTGFVCYQILSTRMIGFCTLRTPPCFFDCWHSKAWALDVTVLTHCLLLLYSFGTGVFVSAAYHAPPLLALRSACPSLDIFVRTFRTTSGWLQSCFEPDGIPFHMLRTSANHPSEKIHNLRQLCDSPRMWAALLQLLPVGALLRNLHTSEPVLLHQACRKTVAWHGNPHTTRWSVVASSTPMAHCRLTLQRLLLLAGPNHGPQVPQGPALTAEGGNDDFLRGGAEWTEFLADLLLRSSGVSEAPPDTSVIDSDELQFGVRAGGGRSRRRHADRTTRARRK